MARRRSKLYKQISNVHVETVAEGDWSSFMKLDKQDPSMRSCYIDKVRISWVVDTQETSAAQQGLLFVASHDSALNSTTPSANDGNIIAASASRGGAGVITLDIKRRIDMSYDGADAGVLELLEGSNGPIYLHSYKADTGSDANFYLVVETWGRWFSAESL